MEAASHRTLPHLGTAQRSHTAASPLRPPNNVADGGGAPTAHSTVEPTARQGASPQHEEFTHLVRNTGGEDGSSPFACEKESWHSAINHNNSIWIRKKKYFVLKSTKNKLSFTNTIIAGF